MEGEIERIEKLIIESKQRLAELRREVPRRPVEDYAFGIADGGIVKLSELFGDKRDLLVVHNMGASCIYCTMWADGFNGLRKHLENRAAFVVSSPDEPQAQARFAASRGWGFRMISVKGTLFAADMGYEPEPGDYYPGITGFCKDDSGTVYRVASAPFGPGDDFCATWPMLDLLADGANGWEPEYKYAES
jgi:predicted dithiol-disulfide oxidoreductase (DUF899 family)